MVMFSKQIAKTKTYFCSVSDPEKIVFVFGEYSKVVKLENATCCDKNKAITSAVNPDNLSIPHIRNPVLNSTGVAYSWVRQYLVPHMVVDDQVFIAYVAVRLSESSSAVGYRTNFLYLYCDVTKYYRSCYTSQVSK